MERLPGIHETCDQVTFNSKPTTFPASFNGLLIQQGSKVEG